MMESAPQSTEERMEQTRARMLAHWVAPDPDPATMDLAESTDLVQRFRVVQARHLGDEAAPESELPCPKPRLLAAIMRCAYAAHEAGKPDQDVRQLAWLTVDVQSFLPDDQVQRLRADASASGQIADDVAAMDARQIVEDARAYQLTWLTGSKNPFAALVAIGGPGRAVIGSAPAEAASLNDVVNTDYRECLQIGLAVGSAEVGALWGPSATTTLVALVFVGAPVLGFLVVATASLAVASTITTFDRVTNGRYARLSQRVMNAGITLVALVVPGLLAFAIARALN
jgi:hypothetical protein